MSKCKGCKTDLVLGYEWCENCEPSAEVEKLQARIRELEAERDAARQAGAEAALRWFIDDYDLEIELDHLGFDKEQDIQRGLRAVGGGE